MNLKVEIPDRPQNEKRIFQNESANHISAATKSKVFEDWRVGVSLAQPYDNNACDDAIELSERSKTQTKEGEHKQTCFFIILIFTFSLNCN